jgi:CHAT domain-containing protein
VKRAALLRASAFGWIGSAGVGLGVSSAQPLPAPVAEPVEARAAPPAALPHARGSEDLQAALERYRRPFATAVLFPLGSLFALTGEPQRSLDGQLRAAGELYASALALYRSRSDLLCEGMAQCRLGEVRRKLGEFAAAREAFGAALAAAPQADPSVSACAGAGLARVARDAGELSQARAHADAALARAESIRARAVSHHARAATLASQQALYEVLTDVLMRLHAKDPSAGHAARAFEVSERARTRSLLELLAEGQVDVRRGVDPELLDEERSLRRTLNAKAQAEALSLAAGRTQRAERLGHEADGMLARLAETEARIRIASPQYAALTQPRPLTLAEIRDQVLDAETQLLQYTLGASGGQLWVVSAVRLDAFPLAPRAQIERAVRELRARVAGPPRAGGGDKPAGREAALRELSRLLLAPAAGVLDAARRLLIVAPGALQYVPFACLPLPEQAGRPRTAGRTARAVPAPPTTLVSRFELVSAPSASVIATLRRASAEAQRPSKTAAVFADPVFETTDPRLAKTRHAPGGRAPERAVGRTREASGGRLGRLPFSRREAESIVRLAPAGQAWKATGFDANLEAVARPELAEYRVVHFATHGVLDVRRPELSGVVLSLFDRAGRERDGFLRLHDVYNLKLSADLVVLSGCQTALGKELEGEGLMGLTHGFLYAGARSVLASLWPVDDESTAELMKRFYRAMLKDGRRPADALRTAQLELSGERRWSAPFHWAGFVLQGEWR